MGKLYFLIIIFITLSNIIMANSSSGETITFYKVPLVCGAAPDIGCGSRAKPILLEMENNPSVLEAWLNREGTVYAIVWKENERTDDIAKPLFEKYNIEYTVLSINEAQKQFADFRQDGKWLRGTEVDKLSLEEAGRIAETATKSFIDEGHITSSEGNAIRADIEEYFKNELVKIRTEDELRNDSETIFQTAIVDIYVKHVGAQRTSQMEEVFRKKLDEQNKNIQDCCSDECCK